MRCRRGGFSLVELLVVIAILGVLIGILLPALRAARLASRRTLCASRLRELTAACVHYTSTTARSRTRIPPRSWAR